MANDSSQAGYLLPFSDNGIYDDALEDFYQSVLRALTALDGTLVRPKFPNEPSQQPDFDVDWMTFTLSYSDADSNVYEGHDGDAEAGQGDSTLERDKIVTARHTFYGPNRTFYAERLRVMLDLRQNRDELITNGFGLITCGNSIQLPALIKEHWVRKCEMNVTYRFRAVTKFRVLNLLSAQATIHTDEPPRSVSINVNQ